MLRLMQTSAAVLALAMIATRGDAAPPNFVIILADDMGYADLSCFGNDRYETPHLDVLAREGLRFTDFHSNGPVCSPTRAALVTGRYQQRCGVTEVVFADPARGKRDAHGLPPEEATFAELLRPAGYRTALFGKWHLGYAERFNPVHQGFDEFRGFVSGNIDYHSHFDQADFADWWQGLELRDEPGYTTHLINRHAVRFIEEHRDRPFCLYVAHEAPHSPFQGPHDPPVRGPQAQPPLKDPQEIQRAYREMVQAVDQGVGEIVAALRRTAQAERTLIFFCSDNGGTREANNGPLRGLKGSLWEGGHRVPAIAWRPGTIPAGKVTHQAAATIDLLPTMLELAGLPAPTDRPLDGVSLARVLTDDAPLPARRLFWSYNTQRAVREGDWKLLLTVRAAGEERTRRGESIPDLALFNLADDPAESRNLASEQPQHVERLRQSLLKWERSVTPTE